MSFKALALNLVLATAATLASVSAQAFELTPGKGHMDAFRKIQCSMNEGEPIVYSWRGRAYSRVPGERDRLLFRVEGMNIRQCGKVTDPELGEGFRFVTREILLYQDPKTGEILREWKNPWSGETVEVIHVTNDPVNQRPIFPVGRDGKPFEMPFEISGNHWWLTSTVPLFYHNVLGGDYQKYVGGTYHATEMFNFFGDLDDLTDDNNPSARIKVGWERMSDWLPWMEMNGRAGLIYFHTAGIKLNSYDELPEQMKTFIAEEFPIYAEAPPLDDQRKNETSWTYFKKVKDAEKGKSGAH